MTSDRALKVPQTDYYHGFDYIRAVACLFVLALHSNIPAVRYYTSPDTFSATFGDWFYYQVLLMAVPVFFLVSLYLFSIKLLGDKRYILKRLSYLLSLYGFWSAIYIAQRMAFAAGMNTMDDFIKDFTTPKLLIIMIATGGGGVYYFFFSLIVLSICMYLYMIAVTRVKGFEIKHVMLMYLASILFVPAIQVYSAVHYFPLNFWNSLCFLPYVFAAPVLICIFNNKRLILPALYIHLLLYAVMCIIEWRTINLYHMTPWQIEPGPGLLPQYARLSLVFGSMTLVIFSFRIRYAPPSIVRFLSKYSLGIYCIHTYEPLFKLTAYAAKTYNLNILNISNYTLLSGVHYISRLVDSIGLTYLMKKTRKLSRFV